MKFLTDEDILKQVQKLCAKRQPLLIAVSYWGKDAVKETGLRHRIEADPTSVRIICDLWSGACNPAPIQELIESEVEVKTLDHFHAKVWVCGSDILIGSANVSSNGLGFDDTKSIKNNIEAAVRVRDSNTATTVRRWFENQWENKSYTIEPDEIKQAQKFWNERRNSRDRKRAYSTTLIQKIESDRNSRELDNIYVIVWEEDKGSTPDRTRKFFEKQSIEHYTESEQDDRRWFYDCPVNSKWKFQKGNVYLDYTIPHMGDPSEITYNGIYRIVTNSFLTAPNGRKLVPYCIDSTCNGFWFPETEQDRLRERIVNHVKEAGRDERDDEDNFLDKKLTDFWQTK